jgi:hypothetical protein
MTKPRVKSVYDVPLDVLGEVWILTHGVIVVNRGTVIHDVDDGEEYVVMDDNAVYVPLSNAIYMTEVAKERISK